MAEGQIGLWKSRHVLSMRFPVLNWCFCSVAKSAYSNMTPKAFWSVFCDFLVCFFLCAQVSSGNCNTTEWLEICNFDPKSLPGLKYEL